MSTWMSLAEICYIASSQNKKKIKLSFICCIFLWNHLKTCSVIKNLLKILYHSLGYIIDGDCFFTEAFPLESRRISMSKRKQRGLFWSQKGKHSGKISERPLFGGKEKRNALLSCHLKKLLHYVLSWRILSWFNAIGCWGRWWVLSGKAYLWMTGWNLSDY